MQNYKVDEIIGEGGFGTVRVATDEKGKKVAIKSVDSDTKAEWKHREIWANTLLKHKNIAKMEKYFNHGSEMCMVFEYVEGSDLFTFLSKADFEPFPETFVSKVFLQILKAMNYAHKKGVFHRDLKLENVMLTFDGKVKIVDWGLAVIDSKRKPVSDCVGSVDYVAPEVFGNQPYQPDAADVFSMGVILYTLLTGTLPFDSKERVKFFQKKTLHPQIIFEAEILLGQDAIDLIKKMLEVNPADRITLKDVLEHSWVRKFKKTTLSR